MIDFSDIDEHDILIGSSMYARLPLAGLVGRIANDGDDMAIQEFHKRSSYRVNNQLCPFVDYVNLLKEAYSEKYAAQFDTFHIAEKAYDLTIDKFSRISAHNGEKGNKLKRAGTDCRFYFNALKKKIENSFQVRPWVNEFEMEDRSGRITQRFVQHHFHLSWLEAQRRSNFFRSRYCWRVSGRNINVWLPLHIKGHERRKWLECHAGPINPELPDEQQRVQELINQRFPKEKFVPADEAILASGDSEHVFWTKLDEYHGVKLTETIAKEKAVNINRLRPAIRNLGRTRLKQMIIQIFDCISDGNYIRGRGVYPRTCSLIFQVDRPCLNA